MADIDEMLKNPAFKSLDAEKTALIKQAYAEIQGKTPMEAVSVIMKYSRSFSSGNQISKEDRDLMIAVMLESLPQNQKEQFKKLLAAMKN